MAGADRSGPKRLAVLLSGSGRTLENLLSRIGAGELPARVTLVVGSRECPGVERARGRGIETLVIPGRIARDRLAGLLDDHGIDVVALAGYLQLVDIPASHEGRVVNIHPALLPSFGGPGMYGKRVHEAVLAAGCKVSGCTVHLCDSEYDRGPILVQKTCEVLESDTPDTLAARVFELECRAYPEALNLMLAGRVRIEGRRARILPE